MARLCTLCSCKLASGNPGPKCRPCMGKEAGLTEDDYPLRERGANGDATDEAIEGEVLHVAHPGRAGVRKPRPAPRAKEKYKKILAVVMSLTPGQCMVARLHVLEGHTLAGAAHIMGITYKAARRRWERVRERVKCRFSRF